MNNFEIINELKNLKKEIKSNNIFILFLAISFVMNSFLKLLILLGAK